MHITITTTHSPIDAATVENALKTLAKLDAETLKKLQILANSPNAVKKVNSSWKAIKMLCGIKE
jgi:hypothetical protein